MDYSRFSAPATYLTSVEKALYSNNQWRIVNAFERQYNYTGWAYTWVPRNSAYDTAWMVGYKVRYGYNTGIQTENNGALTDNTENYNHGDHSGDTTNHGVLNENYRTQVITRTDSYGYNAANASVVPQGAWLRNGANDYTSSTSSGYTTNTITWKTDTKRVYDYGDERVYDLVGGQEVANADTDNLTPTKATYEVRFQNQFDDPAAGKPTEDHTRAAHMSRVKLKSTFDENIAAAGDKVFRLQNVYVPAYLVRDRKSVV